jgi:DNA-binding Lrp family transcriptional regulator
MKSQIVRRKKYDYLDVRIVEMLGKEGPRNIYKIAKMLDMPESTIRHRVNMMRHRKLLRLFTNVYHTHIGLKKGVVFADINPTYADVVGRFMALNPYWAYIERVHCYGEGIYTLYTVPPAYQDKLVKFLDELISLEILNGYQILWSTCFHRVNTTTTWYDLENDEWDFKWDDLIGEIENAPTELPMTLKDPDAFPILADRTDIFILKELEKDATISLTELASKLNTSIQNVHYHFKKHIEERSLIEGY